MQSELKIVSARISKMPKTFFEPLPIVCVTLENSVEELLFEYYPDEISFTEMEFIGLTIPQAHELKRQKDVAYLQS